MTPLAAALALIARGWNPVPVEFRSKKPIGREWQQRVIDRTNVEQFFNGADLNIGLLAALAADRSGLTLPFRLHALVDGLAVLFGQVSAPDPHVDHLDAEVACLAVELVAHARHRAARSSRTT
jgi:hypothetical protein